ncbi:hypothetical protein KW785_03095 [Candidatus Parcubacteria bacterium]|nr:hypothetical protein [Candidatus Parcubacteria bacterium]
MNDLVYIDEFGLLGSNFYWHRYDEKGLTEQEIKEAGLTSDRVQVHKEIIEALINVDKIFQQAGHRLYIKEGYRSKALYEIVYRKRVELFGKEDTDKVMNMRDMPHATGRSVDVALLDIHTGKEIPMRNKEDGTSALFIDFYRDKTDEQSKHYQELQNFVLDIMRKSGFELGTKNEYFHFNYTQ